MRNESIQKIIARFSETFVRLMEAIKNHGHPDLAKAEHEHTDLASLDEMEKRATKDQLKNILTHRTSPYKRHSVLAGIVGEANLPEFLFFDDTTIDDPDHSSKANATRYFHLFHFNTGDKDGSTFKNYGELRTRAYNTGSNAMPRPTSKDNLLHYSAGGAKDENDATTGRVWLGTESTNVFINQWNPAPYSGLTRWSESFIFSMPSSDKDFQENKYIFRNTKDTGTVNSISLSTDNGLAIWASGSKGALVISINKTKYYIKKSTIEANLGHSYGLRSSKKIHFELYYNDGKYSAWIDGNSCPMYDGTGASATLKTSNVTHGGVLADWLTEGNVVIDNPGNWGAARMFGGISGGGYIGMLDEYAFKTPEVVYDPRTSNIATGYEFFPIITEIPRIGTSTELVVNVDEEPISFTVANRLENYTVTLKDEMAIPNVPLNNRTYLYRAIVHNEKDYTVVPGGYLSLNKPQYGKDFDSTENYCLVGKQDLYGNDWLIGDSEKIYYDVVDETEYDSIDYDLDGLGIDLPYVKFIGTNVGDKCWIRSGIDSLPDRWTIRVAFKLTSGKTGNIVNTIDQQGATTSGLGISFSAIDDGKIVLTVEINRGITGKSISRNYFIDEPTTPESYFMIELFYTGFKYGIRVGRASDTDASDSWWVNWAPAQNHDRSDIFYIYTEDGDTYNEPLVLGGNLSIGSNLSGAPGVGGIGYIPGAKYYNFVLMPYVYAFHTGYINDAARVPGEIEPPNFTNLARVDPDLSFFDKSLMRYKYIDVDSTLASEGRPVFVENDAISVLPIAEILSDQGGIVEVIPYAINGRFETPRMTVSANKTYRVLHGIGEREIQVTGYAYSGADDKNPDIFTPTIGNVSHTHFDLVFGGTVPSSLVKLVVTRLW